MEQTRVIKFCFVDKILFDLFCWRKLKQFNDLFLFSCLLVCAVDGYGHDNILMAQFPDANMFLINISQFSFTHTHTHTDIYIYHIISFHLTLKRGKIS